ncbi:hypothetical protein FUA23_04400 [Neolewinella aurantiaca]|uniref:Uncharacterized protein n=1 Tax=Neolewinella aurantiaca TaxID=2602767 RepID=A0A5C7FX80_9BACT|nr:DUF6624 domain-containing protein [Neolewinella aurantiaca]TXF91050.1 hypothetical protein FUA23_04400 [Neolewinella aurantiaca]
MSNSANYDEIGAEIIALKDADLQLRSRLMKSGRLNEGYDAEMNELHDANADALNEIIDSIGYPTTDKVGKEASEAAWLVIQHAIGKPDFLRKCARLLEEAVAAGDANPVGLAYLTDRIAVFEEQPQRYGTQFDWREDGQLWPQACDDLVLVDERRKAIGLNTLAEQTKLIRYQAEQENHSPPSDLTQRTQALREWKERVGWL